MDWLFLQSGMALSNPYKTWKKQVRTKSHVFFFPHCLIQDIFLSCSWSEFYLFGSSDFLIRLQIQQWFPRVSGLPLVYLWNISLNSHLSTLLQVTMFMSVYTFTHIHIFLYISLPYFYWHVSLQKINLAHLKSIPSGMHLWGRLILVVYIGRVAPVLFIYCLISN